MQESHGDEPNARVRERAERVGTEDDAARDAHARQTAAWTVEGMIVDG